MDENASESILEVDVYHNLKNSSIIITPKSNEIECEAVNFNLKDYIDDSLLYFYKDEKYSKSPKINEDSNDNDSLLSKLTSKYIINNFRFNGQLFDP